MSLSLYPKFRELLRLPHSDLFCNYRDIVHSRKDKIGDYYLTIGPVQEVRPQFQIVEVLETPWKDVPLDDRQVGSVALCIVDRKPFSESAARLLAVREFVGFLLPATVDPQGVISSSRLLFANMKLRKVEKEIQCLSMGLSSVYYDFSRNRCQTIEVRYAIAHPAIRTLHQGEPFFPLLVVNAPAILEFVQNTGNVGLVWQVFIAVVATAVGYSLSDMRRFGLYIRGPNRGSIQPPSIGQFVEFERVPDDLTGAIHVLLSATAIILIPAEEMNSEVYINYDKVHLRPNRARKQPIQTTDYVRALEDGGGMKSMAELSVLPEFGLTIDPSRLCNREATFTDQELTMLRNDSCYERIVAGVEPGFYKTHIQEKGFPLRPTAMRKWVLLNAAKKMTANEVLKATVSEYREPNYLFSRGNTCLTFLVLDDIRIPPLLLRDNRTWPLDVGGRMLEAAWEDLEAAYKGIVNGEGDNSEGRDNKFKTITSHARHEFA